MAKCDFTKVFQKLDCGKYSETGRTVQEGLNCFSFIVNYLRETDHDVSLEDDVISGDYTYSNILEKWEQDDGQTVQAVIDSFGDFIYRIKLSEIRPGDILVLIDPKTDKKFPAVYVTNGKVATMTKRGSGRMRLSNYKVSDIFRGKNI